MKPKAIALLSGGLDSALAICLVKEQGIEIEALYFSTMFGCCKTDASLMAHKLGVPFRLLKVGDDYLKVVEKPKYGYGRGVNPCVDCRIYMFAMAKEYMLESGASFLISGEVLDQRPMSQKLRDFKAIEADLGLEGKIVRPLSAKRLPLTDPEREGILNREKFLGIHGRSRKQLLQLAKHYGIEDPPHPSAGCALTSPAFAKKVRDVFRHHPGYARWEFEILKIGRHFRLDPQTKVVIARNHDQNNWLEAIHPDGTTLLTCENFGGPHALLIGEANYLNLEKTSALMLRYAQKPLPENPEIQIEKNGEISTMRSSSTLPETELEALRIIA